MQPATLLGSRSAWRRALPALCVGIYCAVASGQGAPDTPVPNTPSSGNSLPPAPAAAAATSEAEVRFQQGLRLAAARQTEAAIKIFSGLTADYPLLPQPYVQLAALYVQQGKLPRAIDSLHAALERTLDDGALQESLGDLYVELAKQSYREASSAANPSSSAADKYALLQKIGSRPVTKATVAP
jgi:tetratricopeptide (TPR) repeat protein